MPIIIGTRKTLLYQQGKTEEQLTLAEKMLKDGVHIPLVHKYTGITIPKLEKLTKKFKIEYRFRAGQTTYKP